MKASWWKRGLVLVGLGAFSSLASADFIATIAGNDCSGVFGQGFADCKIPAQYDPDQSPIIIKFNFNENGTLGLIEINSALFPTIDGTEFGFVFGGGGSGTGTWTYTPGVGDPGIEFFVAKGGDDFNLFSNLGDPLTDTWFTPNTPSGSPASLSHLSFYDTNGGQQVPEPATLALIGAAMLAIALSRRRIKLR